MHFAAHFPSFHGRYRVHGPFFRVEAPVPVIVFLVVSLFLLLGTMAAFGQSPAHNPSQPAVLETIPLSDHCPLNLSAQQGMSGELRNAKVLPHLRETPSQPAQQIRLTLANTRLTGITAARIKVRGYTPNGRIMPSGTPPPDAVKSLDLLLVVGPKQDVSTDLRLESFSAVTSIELESVTYADGSRWQTSTENRCEIAPDPLMLITSR
jgi:hypothetical protein